MMHKTELIKNVAARKFVVKRKFDAALPVVWKAWTQSNLLDQWWAPKPWKAETRHMDFRNGGSWLYCMVGPDGMRHWARADYHRIEPLHSFSVTDAFCDEEGTINNELPVMQWEVDFSEENGGTMVTVEISFSKPEDAEKIMEMGFQEGFAAAHDNLDELLAKGKIS